MRLRKTLHGREWLPQSGRLLAIRSKITTNMSCSIPFETSSSIEGISASRSPSPIPNMSISYCPPYCHYHSDSRFLSVRRVHRDEKSYYETLLEYSRKHLMLYPYHLSDFIVTQMRVTPFQYYISIMQVNGNDNLLLWHKFVCVLSIKLPLGRETSRFANSLIVASS